ncbi:MAG: transcription-repair coupling factor [Chloroflexi bacterium]|nr:transcription-repair coupling factor [Chloroflexota bacterium]
MQLTGLLDFLRDSPLYRALLVRLQERQPIDNLNVLRSARPFFLAALAREWEGPVLYVTGRIDRAYNVSEQLPVWLGDARPIYRFGEPAPMFYERTPWGENVIRNRIATLAALVPPDDFMPAAHPVIVTSARAIMQRTLPVHQFRKGAMLLKVGQRHHLNGLLAQWMKMGYEPVSIVVEPGTFSRRGGVVDIYPLAADRPVRVEFFDDEIDSLRRFDPSTQRSAELVEHVSIVPAREALPEFGPPVAAHLASWFDSLPPNDSDVTSPRADAEPLANGAAFPYLEHYLPYMFPNPVSLLDYAPDNALVVTEDWEELSDTVATIEEQALRTRQERLEAGQLPPDYPLPYITWDALAEELESRAHVHLGYGTRGEADDDEDGDEPENGDTGAPGTVPLPSHTLDFRRLFAPEERFGGQLRAFLSRARQMRRDGGRVIVVTQQTARIADLWQEQETFLPTMKNVPEPPQPHTLALVDGTLREGWRLRQPDGNVHLVTDAEIFGWNRPEPRRRKVQRRARVPESSYADLHEGDYVVHIDYGIGRFAGMRRRTLEGNEREYLVVEYGGNDTVFVPIHQADRLTRYVGPDDRPPALSRLGKPDWAKVTTQARKAVEEEAKELLELYAKREDVSAPAFVGDTAWQHELEASFPFVETDDQLRAIRDVKVDLEETHPMDRLICGDVGYGKTEVALRAAFKAVNAGYQVALLVPTTVLAQQHYETFSNRLAPFPVKVEMLSRFRNKDDQQSVLKQLAAGDVDIIIGTHRLLQDDVKFKKLGLVIIDEEQRFGVTHKEHLKKLRTEVHVLTMTATPIPRTLYMSLAGVRDISMIQTPPEERLPVITHVGPMDERLVRQAVLRELERGGQIFYVHNRVQSIDAVRDRLEQIVPEARIITGHGQMDERLLEKVMSAFARGEYDILLSTSIIENGIDIPNANTLIVDRADLFGMSQLYQLRGRVGRSAQQAYAYFFHPVAERLTEEARSRLEALEENTDLGAGFQIAMRDLELRGAGDILSTRQTGHVAAIGLHLYTQLLTQAVQQLKGKAPGAAAPPVSTTNITIDLPIPAYLPSDWIPEMELRLQIYRRVGGLTSLDEVAAMREELRDRFGVLPAAVEGMLFQIEVKLLAQQANATAVINLNDVVNIKLPYLAEVNRERLQRDLGEDVRVSRTAVMLPIQPGIEWRARLLQVLRLLAEGVKEAAGL